MNQTILRQLILKDWFFNRHIIILALLCGGLALALIHFGSSVGFYMGSTLLITIVIGLGVYLIIETVIQERKLQTLPFIMSLPISAMTYTTAKVLANFLTFLVPWSILVIGTILVILTRDTLPDGMVPFAILVLTELLACHCLILATALVTESQGWTIGVMIFCNLFLQLFLFTVPKLAGIKASIEGSAIVWPTDFYLILGIEITTMVIIMGCTFFFQSRKKDFL